MKVYLKRIIEQTIEINIDEESTVRMLKKELYDKKGIPPCLQNLEFNGKKLDDQKFLSKYKIKEGDSIRVLQASGCDGGGCMQIFARNFNGKKVPLGAHTYDTGYDLKEKVACRLDMRSMDITILFNGKALENRVSLDEYNIVDQSVVDVVPRKEMDIFVKMIDGTPLSLHVEEYFTVKKIKDRIFDMIGIPPSMQLLIFNDKMLEDANYLKEYNPTDDSVLWVMQKPSCSDCSKITITVSSPANGQTDRLDVNPCESVRAVTDMAEKILEKLGGRIALFVNLKFNGEFLDKRKTLSECGVKEGDALILDETGIMQIFVKTLTGKTKTFRLRPQNTVLDFKYMIMETLGAPVDGFRLVFAGKMLEDQKTLAECKIDRESTVHMMQRLCGC